MNSFKTFLLEKNEKSVVLYFTAKDIGDPNGACCNICRHFLPKDKCTEVEGDINGPRGICGLYIYGKHTGPFKTPSLSKETASYSEQGPTHCGNCKFYGGEEDKSGPCKVVKGIVEYAGCCNGWAQKKLDIS